MLPLLGIVALAVLVPVLLGARLYIGISEAAFRQIVLGLLTLSGVALLASSLPVLLGVAQAERVRAFPAGLNGKRAAQNAASRGSASTRRTTSAMRGASR